eukprot:TRINITY_DN2863_c2_g1_i1.p1 TRINITY_DN2863_c2_g1~~TRINITY_DN2863_c2_g1_i1.p1  ORF type:complete len:1173 (+),score=170.48 TRINITY_DN2863_c2_g1_i1:99-3521(+)
MRCSPSAKLLMVITTIISTGVSFGGGLIMYLEGLAVIEHTVREISDAELGSTARRLRFTFDAAYDTSIALAGIVADWDTWESPRTLEGLQRFLRPYEFHVTRPYLDEMQGTGLLITPLANTLANRTAFYQTVWWEPLSQNVPEGTLEYVSGTYLPSHFGHERCVPEPNETHPDYAKYRCNIVHLLDSETGAVLDKSYAYSERIVNNLRPGGRWEALQIGWEEHGATWWRAADVWTSTDRTPYIYTGWMRVLKQQTRDHPLWGAGFKVTVTTFAVFSSWDRHLREQAAVDATLVASFLDDGLDSQVLATSVGATLTRGCHERSAIGVGKHPCVVTLRFLNTNIQEACIKASQTAAGYFFRTSMQGELYWVRRLVVHEAREVDELPSVHLVWFRAVSSVEDQLNRSLYLFVGFVSAILVFDVLILIFEIRQIAGPLQGLEWALAPIDGMDLDEASDRLSLATHVGCCRVREVDRLVWRLELTFAVLGRYRAFLPLAVLKRAEEQQWESELYSGKEPPRGTVAICFTDIIASTTLWEASPEGMEEALSLHNNVVRRAMRQWSGYEVKTIGDSFMVAFDDPVNAVLFALQVQEDLLAAPWPDDNALASASPYWSPHDLPEGERLWRGLALRIGIAYGEPRDELNPVTDRVDYRGCTVNLAARCEAECPHGLVLVHDAVRCCAQDTRLLGVEFLPQPPKHMKGIGQVRTHLVCRPRLRPRLRSQLAVRSTAEHRSSAGAVSSPGRRGTQRSTCRASPGSAVSIEGGSSIPSQDTGRGSVRSIGSGGASKVESPRFNLGLSTVLGTVAVVGGLDGEHSKRLVAHREESAAQVAHVLNATLLQCIVCAARTQGKIGAIIGPSAYVDWNVFWTCPSHHAQATAFVMYLVANVSTQVRIGMASGEVLRGNAGSFRQRFPTVLGVPTHAAEELCREAGVLGARCLCTSLPAPPAGLVDSNMRVVDVWLVRGVDGTEANLSIHELDLRELRDRVGEPETEAEEGPPEVPSGLTHEGLFFGALLRGSTTAVLKLQQDAAAAGDAVGLRVAERLAEHVRRHPTGAPSRVDAPFLGLLCASSFTGQCSRTCASRCSSIPFEHGTSTIITGPSISPDMRPFVRPDFRQSSASGGGSPLSSPAHQRAHSPANINCW